MGGIVWCLCICTLIGNSQPFGFLVDRHCLGSCGETFHDFSEALVEGLYGCDYFCDSCIEVLLEIFG